MNEHEYRYSREISLDEWREYTSVLTHPPRNIPTPMMVDGPLMGNGDVGVTIGGPAECLDYYLSKNDFWYQTHIGETEEQRLERLHTGVNRRTGTRIMMLGLVSLIMPALKGASYYVEQDICNAEIRGRFMKADTALKTTSFVAANENLLLVTLANVGRTAIDVEMRQKIGAKDLWEVYGYDQGREGSVCYMTRHANLANIPGGRSATIATKVLTASDTPNSMDKITMKAGETPDEAFVRDPGNPILGYQWQLIYYSTHLTLEPGCQATIAISIISDLDDAEYSEKAKEMVDSLDKTRIEEIKTNHRHWWKEYWMKSSIVIDDRKLLKHYYTSYYVLGCCTRAGKVPPGLFGNWITTDTPYCTASYTMNYNYQMPFLCVYSGNRQEIIESYCEPLLDIISLGKEFADTFLDCAGIYLPVELGPWGTVCSMLFWGQKSNAAFGAANLIMHYQVTRDPEYAARIYPYLIEVMNFWEDYLVYEDDTYVIYDDAVHEGSDDKKNPIVSLGLIRMVAKALLHLSGELGRDEDRREKWEHILERLSPFPTYERRGETVFRLAEEGMDWEPLNSVALQHVYPAGCIGLDSDPELLKIARDTVMQKESWFGDGNAFPTIYPMAARVGVDPTELLRRLTIECENKAMPNGLTHHAGGGLEDANGVTSTLNEMLMQSHEEVVRLFPVWPKTKDAAFCRLRAHGAFLVSAEYREGCVQYAVIESERGVDCTVHNPWEAAAIYCDDKLVAEASEARFTFRTEIGKRYLLLHGN
ncbi:glycoside hydrolase family 95-like protein [Candidatus Sumerlaeota bacterium]